MLEFIAFLVCLEFAVVNSAYRSVVLKPKQVICLENVYLDKDVVCVLPTGYGKSLIFHLIPSLMFARSRLSWRSLQQTTFTDVSSIVIVVCPLNALIKNQIFRLRSSGVQASAISVNYGHDSAEELELYDQDQSDRYECEFYGEKEKLIKGEYCIVFAHPECFISTKFGRGLMMSKPYKERVVAIVVDEAHCILDW